MTTPRGPLREPYHRIEKMVGDRPGRPKTPQELAEMWEQRRKAGLGDWTALEALAALYFPKEGATIKAIDNEIVPDFMIVPRWAVAVIAGVYISVSGMDPKEARRILQHLDEETRSDRVAKFMESAPEGDPAKLYRMLCEDDEKTLSGRAADFSKSSTLDKLFDMQGRKKHFQNENEKEIVSAVIDIKRTGGAKLLTDAMKVVADREGISFDTVKKYYQKHKDEVIPLMGPFKEGTTLSG